MNRYTRQIILAQIGEKAQARLKNARVLCVGLGGLGCAVSLALCTAGVGHLALMDGDDVDISNLPRQVLHQERFLGCSKTLSVLYQLQQHNHHTQIELYNFRLTDHVCAVEIIYNYDIVIDATDNTTSKHLLQKACTEVCKPLIYGSVWQWNGIFGVCNYRGKSCLAMNEMDECMGVFSMLPSVIGFFQALETLKVLLGISSPVKFMYINSLHMRWFKERERFELSENYKLS
jgi:molybdopterin/thiamine biosynthesis adenylyltransferase|uniref:Molybdopterin biosynthesis protein n=1 Tax=Cyanidiaceae sp. MX-AZ01 TaxID=1503164 RepID=A0A060ADX4_9RHOD|nr:molybdopterin biosynthesis protein [Cyanidiaceae sp. MX-AZ01]